MISDCALPMEPPITLKTLRAQSTELVSIYQLVLTFQDN